MKTAIMQPYFFPYIGYFQLIKAVDKFVVYDNIQYIKNGWINRNRFLQNGKDNYFTLPLRKDSAYLDIKDRFISNDFDKKKLCNQIKAAYAKAPFYSSIFPIFEEIIYSPHENLFEFVYASLLNVCEYIGIKTEFIISSSVSIDHTLKSEDKVLAICRALSTTEYINAIGGMELYSKECFAENHIKLNFLKTQPIEYPQLNHHPFVPYLSILDVLMFNSVAQTNDFLMRYELI